MAQTARWLPAAELLPWGQRVTARKAAGLSREMAQPGPASDPWFWSTARLRLEYVDTQLLILSAT